MRPLPNDEEIRERLGKALEESWKWKLAAADARLTEAQRQGGGERARFGGSDGPAAIKAMIDPAIYHAAMSLYGPKCWDDPGFLKDYLKRHPAGRVNSKRVNPTVGWRESLGVSNGGLLTCKRAGTPVFRKTY
jgi:hypothetical protein